MKFYHEVRGCSLAVDIVARELGLALDLQWVDMANKRLADGSDYLKVNSKGTVPTLELPDGQFLSEDAVIMQYLADQRPQQGMLPAAGTLATRLVVVVLPCVPATAMPRFRRISSASITARGTTGMRAARAARTSGLSPATAVEVTMAPAPATLARSCPMAMRMPSSARRRVTADSFRSEPLMV